MSRKVKPIKRLFGDVTLPGDKSISHRAIMVGSISKGLTRVKGLLNCDDTNFTIHAFKNMGIVIEEEDGLAIIKGKGLKGLTKPRTPIHVGNSGTTIRLLAGILAGQDFETTLMGDESLSNRPMRRVVEPLSLMGVDIRARSGEYPPITIRGGKVKPIDYRMPIPSAQVKSAILLAGLYAKGLTNVEEKFKSRDHTERMLKYFGSRLRVERLKVSLEGGCELVGREFEIPGDISSASFFLVGACLLEGSKIRINRVGINPTRSGVLSLLSKMGARMKILNKTELFEPVGDIEVKASKTKGIVIKEDIIPSIIDELPIVFVLASLSRGRTVIRGARELRVKETDRITSMERNLKNMGAKIELKGDEMIIEGTEELRGASLKSFNDHRTCMALVIAALTAKGDSTIDDVGCVNKSFPGFFETLDKILEE